MYVVQKQISPDVWEVASEHTQLADAKYQIQIFVSNGISESDLKLSQRKDDGSLADLV